MGKLLINIVCVLLLSAGHAQELKEIFIDTKSISRETFTDSLQQNRWIRERMWKFWSSGYVFAGLDSITETGIYLHRGVQYKSRMHQVYLLNPDSALYVPTSSKKPLDLARRYSNSGYPFSELGLDSVDISAEQYKAFYSLKPGPYIQFDSIALLSDVPINRTYLQKALSIPAGEPFSEKSYAQIAKKLERVDFLSLKKPPDIAFEDGRSIIYLDLRQEARNSFEGVVGFLPNQAQGGGLAITGYLDLGLANLFQSGIDLDLTWNRFANESQELDLHYFHPYVLSSEVYLDLSFGLLKQDTTYLTRAWKLGVGTPLWNRLFLQIAYENTGGSMISADPEDFRNGFADFQTNYYGLQIGHSRYGTPFGYTSGLRFSTSLAVGDKTIMTNSELDDRLYDSLDLNSLILNVSAGMSYQVLLFKRAAWFHEIRSQGFFNDQVVNNEISRVGGLRSMRGFNENFFFAQHYLLSRMEFRQYFEERSFFMLFYDQLFYALQDEWDQPMGFGGGINLNTSNGLFTFALALGKARNISLNFANTKVHFGYTTTF